MEPTFLTLGEVLAVHRDQVDRYGGSHGLRDKHLLESAVATPAATFGGKYLHADLPEMAAAYLFHLSRNHPFVDGNKRIGAATACVFLLMNRLQLTASEDDYAELVLSVARSEADKPTVVRFYRENTTKA